MNVTEKGQVTIPKAIRDATGVQPGSRVEFSVEGGRIVITPVATGLQDDRRARMQRAAARVRAEQSPEFRQLGADQIMAFLRAEEPTPPPPSPAKRVRARR